jgi:preprotein translocase subunit SecD
MRYGALPIPFEVVESRLIGPTLGQDSLQKSLVAGLIGFRHRHPLHEHLLPPARHCGDPLDPHLRVLTLAMFKLIPVTLTLPGIAGFLLEHRLCAGRQHPDL